MTVPKFWPVGKADTSEEMAESKEEPLRISRGLGIEVTLSGSV